MGLRCLLGHDFAEPTTEREREERGDEVIATVRRVKECRRCGETRVVSENKEVTSVERPGRDGAAADAGNEGRSRATPGWADDAADDAGSGSGPEFDHPEADLDGVDTDVEDDAEIIRSSASDDDSGVRGRGEWPDADVNRSTVDDRTSRGGRADDRPDPRTTGRDDADGGDDRGTTDPAEEDAEFIDADAGGGVDAGIDTGSETDDRVPWPDHDGEDEGYDAAFGVDTTGDGDEEADEGGSTAGADDAGSTEFIEAESDPLDATADVDATTDSGWGTVGSTDPSGPAGRTEGADDRASGADGAGVSGVELRTASDDPDAEYVCPECGAHEPVGASSMRAGDICPECKRGYIEERELDRGE